MNKRFLKTSLSALLTASMLAGMPVNALSYTGLGEVIHLSRDTIGDGLTYSSYTSVDEAGKKQQSYIFEYDPAGGVLPLVRWGNTVYGKDRLGSLVSAAWSDGKAVLGAVNGDFYSMKTGVPLGVMIDGSKLISTDDSRYALGFTADGKAVIGKPSVKLTMTDLTRGGAVLTIDQLNKFPTQWGVYMVTDDFASTTLSAAESREIIIKLDGDITLGGSVTGTVRDIIEDDYNCEIPSGCAVISVAESWETYSLFSGIAVGDQVRIDATCAEGWENVVTAIGGGDLILENGVMPEGIIDEDHEKTDNPRTAAGIREDGTVVFFSVDGRSEASQGLDETELSAVMAEMGCVTALNLDGGGSTTVMVRSINTSKDDTCVYVNAPSDGYYRSISNGILFVSEYEPDGKAAVLAPLPNTPLVLRESTVQFFALELDKSYTRTGVTHNADQLTLAFADDYADEVGSISGSSFTAGLIPGEYRMKLTSTQNKELSGDVSVIVTDKLDSLEVTPSYERTTPGSLVKLTVDATYAGQPVITSPEAFYYTLNGTHVVPDPKDYPDAMIVCDIGYLDKNGSFQTFAGCEGEVEIGVWFDQFVRYVTVKVGTGSDVIADFEDAEQLGGVKLGSDGSDIYLKYADTGYKSEGALEVGFSYADVDMDTVVSVGLTEPFPVSPAAESIKLWVWGDITGALTATVTDENGTEYNLTYTVTKDYARQTGWRELTAVIPASMKYVKNGTLYIKSLLNIRDTGTAERSIMLDNAIVYYGEADEPTIEGLDGHWAASAITMLYDMGVITEADCEKKDGVLTYAPDKALTRGEFAKLITLWLGQDVTPYEKEGVSLEKDAPSALVPYIRSALAHGLMSGRGTLEDGTVLFDASATITREEAMKVIGLLLSTPETELGFTDAEEIADWAKSGIAKCVSAGVVRGYDDNTIRPKATISRGELAVMLGRM